MTIQQKNKGIDAIVSLAESGDGGAMDRLGRAYHEGKGVEQNLNLAAEWMRKAAGKNIGRAKNELFDILWKIGTPESYSEAISVATEFADAGDGGAMGRLGRSYRDGKGVEKDLDKAAEWMRKAADKNVGWAKNELFDILWKIGTPESYSEAISVATEFADAGDGGAMGRLGRSYRDGKGVEKDLDKAAEWMRKAADKNVGWAKKEYYHMLLKNINSDDSIQSASDYLDTLEDSDWKTYQQSLLLIQTGTIDNIKKGERTIIKNSFPGVCCGIQTQLHINPRLLQYTNLAIMGSAYELDQMLICCFQFNLRVDFYIVCDEDTNNKTDCYGRRISTDMISNNDAIVCSSKADDWKKIKADDGQIFFYDCIGCDKNIFLVKNEQEYLESKNVSMEIFKDYCSKMNDKHEYYTCANKLTSIETLDTMLFNEKCLLICANSKSLCIYPIAKLLHMYEHGKQVFFNLKINESKYVMTYDVAMGDQYRILAPRDGVKNDYSLIVTKVAEDLPSMFNIESVILSKDEHIDLIMYLSFLGNYNKPISLLKYRPIFPGVGWKVGCNLLLYDELAARYHSIELSATNAKSANYKKITNNLTKVGGSTILPNAILINPYGNNIKSIHNLPEKYWRTMSFISKLLLENGYVVYTNTPYSSQNELPGTIRYSEKMNNTMANAHRFSMIISCFTGFIEALMHTECNLAVLTHGKETRFEMASNCSHKNYTEFHIDDDEEAIADKIIQLLVNKNETMKSDMMKSKKAMYLIINRDSEYGMACIQGWMDVAEYANLDLFIVCDNSELSKKVMTLDRCSDVQIMPAKTKNNIKIVEKIVSEFWIGAACAHILPHFHSVENGYKEYWMIDGDDMMFLLKQERIAELFRKVELIAHKERKSLLSLDVWHSRFFGKHWSFGVVYAINDFDTSLLINPAPGWENEKLSTRNLDWYYTYLEKNGKLSIGSYYVEGALFIHWGNLFLNRETSNIIWWNEGKVILPINEAIDEEYEWNIAKGCYKIDIGCSIDESKKFLKNCTSKRLSNRYVPLSVDEKYASCNNDDAFYRLAERYALDPCVKNMHVSLSWFVKALMNKIIGDNQVIERIVKFKYCENEEMNGVLLSKICDISDYKNVLYGIAKIYREGKGVEQNLNLAAEWMRKAAGKNIGRAKNELFDILWKIGTPESYSEAISVATEFADAGDGGAMGRLGRSYRDGKGVEKDLDKAAEWMRKAADKNVGWAKNELFDILWKIGTPESYSEAISVATEFADAGDGGAMGRLGRSYRDGKGVEKDLDKAAEWMRKAADKNVGWAKNELFDILWKIGTPESYSEAISVATEFADAGDGGAMGRLGRSYRDGKGVEKDLDKAAEWMRKAADKNVGWAKNELFDILWKIGTPESYSEAISVATEFADAGDGGAMGRLGRSYRDGKGVEKDLDKAAEWMRKAADKNVGWAKNELFDILWKIGTPESYSEAISVATEFADAGDGGAMGRLGRSYRDGKGVEKDLDKAAEWMRKAADKNVGWAKNELFDILWKIGTPESYSEAISVATEFADAGDGGAMGRLGRSYRDGKGVEKDLDKAAEWMRKAADKNVGWAKNELFDIEEQLDVSSTPSA